MCFNIKFVLFQAEDDLEIETLESLIMVADIHAERIRMAFRRLDAFLPLTEEMLNNLSEENLGFLEILTSRFGKLQDLIGAAIFPMILKKLEVDIAYFSLIDCLNRLEKLGFLESADIWRQIRGVRNKVVHEYPLSKEKALKNLEEIIEQTQALLNYWKFLRNEITQRVIIGERL